MKKSILNFGASFMLLAMLFSGCNKSEKALLASKVYFDKPSETITVEGSESEMTHKFASRLSNMVKNDVTVQYAVADESFVNKYNKRNGTEYKPFKAEDAVIAEANAIIKSGDVFAPSTSVTLKNLDKLEGGSVYLLPITIKSSSSPIIEGSKVQYLVISRPLRIRKACEFSYSYWLKYDMPADAKFSSVTYETLIYVNQFNMSGHHISTIMGREGELMFRFGDTTISGDQMQIAGGIQFHAEPHLDTHKWYHIAFTYDANAKKARIYLNGEKVAEGSSDKTSFDLTKDMFVGKIAGFMWGERPIRALMSEVRIWSVARSENEIAQNMMFVDPKTEGLYAYYKLDGTDETIEDGGKIYLKDRSSKGTRALSATGSKLPVIKDLPEPIKL